MCICIQFFPTVETKCGIRNSIVSNFDTRFYRFEIVHFKVRSSFKKRFADKIRKVVMKFNIRVREVRAGKLWPLIYSVITKIHHKFIDHFWIYIAYVLTVSPAARQIRLKKILFSNTFNSNFVQKIIIPLLVQVDTVFFFSLCFFIVWIIRGKGRRDALKKSISLFVGLMCFCPRRFT